MSQKLRAHFEKIIPLTDEEFDSILSNFSTKKLKKHQFLIQEGDNIQQTYYVLSGLLKAYHIDKEGKEHILQFAMEDWWITDFQAYFNQTKSTIYVDCIENSELLCVSYDNSETSCKNSHKVEHYYRKKANAGYVALQNRILSLLNNNAKERYELFLQQYPKLLQRVPKSLIASYLGVSRETLSRLSNKSV